jgi:membrane peptidoglycan carboxypeptidase
MENKTKRQLVISEETAFMMTSMLKDVVASGGTGSDASIGVRPPARPTTSELERRLVLRLHTEHGGHCLDGF